MVITQHYQWGLATGLLSIFFKVIKIKLSYVQKEALLYRFSYGSLPDISNHSNLKKSIHIWLGRRIFNFYKLKNIQIIDIERY